MNRPCRYPGCPNTKATRGYCETHADRRSVPFQHAQNKVEHRSAPYDATWRNVRLMHLRAHPLCVECDRAGEEVDHIIPLRMGGTHDEGNLQTLCKPCHSRKTIREQARERQRNKALENARNLSVCAPR